MYSPFILFHLHHPVNSKSFSLRLSKTNQKDMDLIGFCKRFFQNEGDGFSGEARWSGSAEIRKMGF